MESIEKLREWSHRYDKAWIQKDGSIIFTTNMNGAYYGDNYGEAIRLMIDAIEREIAERYMLLPVDADGVPIRTGDLIQFNDKGERLEVTHFGFTKYGEPTIAYRRPNGTLDSSCIGKHCTHVKPRTLEDVLNDFAEAIEERGTEWVDVSQTANTIRELMRGDAE